LQWRAGLDYYILLGRDTMLIDFEFMLKRARE
jgi:hypothetical protein